MSKIRKFVGAVVLVLLALGYFCSQAAYLQGLDAAVNYATRVDTPPVAYLALGILVLAVFFAFRPEADGVDPERSETP
jgi:hypothetical protein